MCTSTGQAEVGMVEIEPNQMNLSLLVSCPEKRRFFETSFVSSYKWFNIDKKTTSDGDKDPMNPNRMQVHRCSWVILLLRHQDPRPPIPSDSWPSLILLSPLRTSEVKCPPSKAHYGNSWEIIGKRVMGYIQRSDWKAQHSKSHLCLQNHLITIIMIHWAPAQIEHIL